jgi:hypothetical protein
MAPMITAADTPMTVYSSHGVCDDVALDGCRVPRSTSATTAATPAPRAASHKATQPPNSRRSNCSGLPPVTRDRVEVSALYGI